MEGWGTAFNDSAVATRLIDSPTYRPCMKTSLDFQTYLQHNMHQPPPKTNMEPENGPLEKERLQLQTTMFRFYAKLRRSSQGRFFLAPWSSASAVHF